MSKISLSLALVGFLVTQAIAASVTDKPTVNPSSDIANDLWGDAEGSHDTLILVRRLQQQVRELQLAAERFDQRLQRLEAPRKQATCSLSAASRQDNRSHFEGETRLDLISIGGYP